MHSAQGFTLIELLLVVVIISTISVFSFAGFSDVSKVLALKEDALNVESNLRFTHNQAINGVRPFLACGDLIDYRMSMYASLNKEVTRQYTVIACGSVVKASILPTNTFLKGFIFYLSDGTTLSTDNVYFHFQPSGEIKFSYLVGRTSINVEAKSADIELIYGTDTTRSYIVNVQASGGTLISKRGI